MRHERISVTDEAAELNQQLKGTVAERLLSRQGVRAYYPKSGIPGQTMEAKGTQINATSDSLALFLSPLGGSKI